MVGVIFYHALPVAFSAISNGIFSTGLFGWLQWGHSFTVAATTFSGEYLLCPVIMIFYCNIPFCLLCHPEIQATQYYKMWKAQPQSSHGSVTVCWPNLPQRDLLCEWKQRWGLMMLQLYSQHGKYQTSKIRDASWLRSEGRTL